MDRAEVLAEIEAIGKALVQRRDYPLRQHAGNKAVWASADQAVRAARRAYAAIRRGADVPETLRALGRAGIEANCLGHIADGWDSGAKKRREPCGARLR